MEPTEDEQLEVNEFSTKYPTIYKMIQPLTKKIDELEDEVSRLKDELKDKEGTYSGSG